MWHTILFPKQAQTQKQACMCKYKFLSWYVDIKVVCVYTMKSQASIGNLKFSKAMLQKINQEMNSEYCNKY